MWGAVTAKLGRTIENPNYKALKDLVRKNLIFSYFFILENKNALYPIYTEEGIKYGNKEQSTFESKYITSYVSTAVEKTSGTAEDGSLHEIELLQHNIENKKVTLVGYLLVKEGEEEKYSVRKNGDRIEIFENEKCVIDDLFESTSTLQVGGERNYGYGRIELFNNPYETEQEGEVRIFDKINVDLDTDRPTIEIGKEALITLSHLLIKEENGKEHFGKVTSMKGDLEPLVGREWGKDGGVGHHTSFGGIGLVPGSEFVLKNSSNTTVEEGKTFNPENYGGEIVIGDYGIWMFNSKKSK